MPSSLLQNRLTQLTFYLHDEALTAAARQRAIEAQVRLILKALEGESVQERKSVLDYLTLLGFGDLIAKQE
jgi:hypothetical protein